jgi:ATP-dependent helicase HrpA
LEQVSLFGLLIVPQRPVAYGRINPAEATAIFIQAALVQGDLKKPLPFMRFNQQQIDDIRAMEDRLRRRDLLIDEQTLFEFYNARLAHVYSLPALVKAIKKMGGDQSLRIKKEDLLRQSPDHDALALFPDRVALGPNTFACEYRFEPGQKQDGLTVKIPITATTSVDPDATDWLVPGLYREKVTALIKGLPKNFRKHLVPVAQTVDRIVAELPYARGNLLTALSRYIHDRFALDIPTATWPISQLPDHLKMRLAFIDQQGRVLSTSRNKSALRASAPKGHVSDAMEEAVRAWARNGITTWDFEDLGTTVTLKGPDKRPSVFHPGLATDAHGIHLRLFRHSREALESHLQGIMALFEIRLAKDIRFLKRNLALPATLTPAARYFGGRQVLEERLYERVRDSLLKKNLRTRSAFDAHADAVVRRGLHQHGQTDKRCLIIVLRAYAAARGTLHDLEAANRANRYVLAFLNDLRAELTNLVPESFLALYDTDRLAHLPRYLKALAVRAQRGAVDLEKDRQRSAAIAVFTKALQGFLRSLGPDVSASKREAIETFHWMIEEYKISVFAQEIKTNGPISNKRLAEQVKRIERMT